MQEVAGSIPISPRDTEMRKEKPNVSTRYGTGEHAGSDVIVAAHVGDLVGEHDRTALWAVDGHAAYGERRDYFWKRTLS